MQAAIYVSMNIDRDKWLDGEPEFKQLSHYQPILFKNGHTQAQEWKSTPL